MVDITHKISTLRTAFAQAVVKVSNPDTINAIKNDKVPKGNVLEAARIAGLFAVKNTSNSIPDCHPLPIEKTVFKFELDERSIRIEVEVQTIYKTGVEVEAIHGVTVAAVTMYDMLKPIDKEIEITDIKLLSKKGGKSHFSDKMEKPVNAVVIVCSDSISAGKKEDFAGKAIIRKLEASGVEIKAYTIIPDEVKEIQQLVMKHQKNGIDLIMVTGGTGLSKRDVTPEAIKPLLEREIQGIAEAMRNYGQDRMPYAMLSRSVAGMIGNSLILAMPGSTRGAEESMDALFPHLLHIFKVMEYSK
jgi:molybdenum cofactor biosynthesis protein MoaC